jgi:putative FmdB family regulatory protein
MPIYEYLCSDCGHVSELLVGIGRNSDNLVCGRCGGSDLARLMSAHASSAASIGLEHRTASTCCGSNSSQQGCVPGSCCGSR